VFHWDDIDQISVGKHLPEDIYLHVSLLDLLPDEIRKVVLEFGLWLNCPMS